MHVPGFFTAPFRLRTWKETAYAVVALPLGVAWFTIFPTLGTTSLSLIVFVVGVPLLAATLWLARVAGRAQREVAGALLGVSIPGLPSAAPEGRPFRRFLQPLVDLATWRAIVYLLVFAFPSASSSSSRPSSSGRSRSRPPPRPRGTSRSRPRTAATSSEPRSTPPGSGSSSSAGDSCSSS
jgi:hypothetical protein